MPLDALFSSQPITAVGMLSSNSMTKQLYDENNAQSGKIRALLDENKALSDENKHLRQELQSLLSRASQTHSREYQPRDRSVTRLDKAKCVGTYSLRKSQRP